MIYSTTRYDSIGYANMDVVANEAYDDVTGTYALLEDNARNEQEIFNTVIAMDIQEAAYMNGLISESSMEVLTEGAIGSFFEKIKAFIKKVWEKIKGIFTHFMAKMQSYFMKDGKAFVNKYRKTIASRINDYSKFKHKWRADKKFEPNYTAASNFLMEQTKKVMQSITKNAAGEEVRGVRLGDDFKFGARTVDDNGSQKNVLRDEMYNTVDKTVKAYADDIDSFKEELYSKLGLDGTDDSSLSKDLEDAMYEDEEEVEGNKHFTEIMDTITGEKNTLKTAKDNYTVIEKAEKALIQQLDKERNRLSKDIKNNEAALINTNALSSLVSAQQTITSRVYGAYLSNLKKHVARCRAVFVKMVAFNPKSVKESAVLEEAAYEAGLYDAESSLFGYEY